MVEQQQNAPEIPERHELRNRYLFEGQLVMDTALHIGGGRATLSPSDSPVILTPAGIPFIPGSSFKGALRSTVEKLVGSLPASVGLTSCGLTRPPKVPAVQPEGNTENTPKLCPTVRHQEISALSAEERQQEMQNLCSTCRLFGSPLAASRINVGDLYMPDSAWDGSVQIRDGVAIDRDSEKAKDRLKYDFEVVPASAEFKLSIVLENATPQDLQLISIGLSEFVYGFGFIGGKRSRGLGACHLQKLVVSSLELMGIDSQSSQEISETLRSQRLSNYLLRREFSTSKEPGEVFLERHITAMFARPQE